MDAGPRPELKAQMDRRDRLVGIALMCGAVACFAGLDGCAKWLNRSIDPLMTVWARYMGSVVVVSALLNPWTVPGLLRTRRPWLQAGRSVLVLVSTILNFIALQYLQLTETVSIMFATPFLVALLAGPMLGEWAGPRRLAAIGVGFLGVLIITRPGLGGMHPAAFLCVIGAVCYALYGISTRILAAHDSSATTMFYSGLAGVVLITPVLPLVWTTPASWLVWALMLADGRLRGARALAPDPRPCARAGRRARALHLRADRLDDGARLFHLRRPARPLDADRCFRRHRLGAVPALPRAGAERRGAARRNDY